jgi:hypothetical protein
LIGRAQRVHKEAYKQLQLNLLRPATTRRSAGRKSFHL